MKKFAMLLVILPLLAGCNRGKGGSEKQTEEQAPLVKYMTMEESYMKESIRLSGDIVASNSVDIFPDVAGKIHSIQVSEGDYVRKGFVVAYIDRNKPGMKFALSPVESPISGTITSVLSNVGAMSSPSIPLFQIGTLDKLEIETYISERDINRVKKGQNAILTTVAYPGEEFSATVNILNPVVNPITRSLKVTLDILNESSLLKAGMFVNIELTTKDKDNALVVSKEILVERNDKHYLWLLLDDKASMKEVKIGLENEKQAEIIEGIVKGDKVITQGFTYLEEGTTVRALTESKEEN